MKAPDEGTREIDGLLPVLYQELRALARAQLMGRGAATLQATALVNEAYVRLASRGAVVGGEQHFRALAARVMRQVLVDHARGRTAAKRGGGRRRVTLGGVPATPASGAEGVDVVALHEALERLAAFGPRQASVVELRFFGGLSMREVADVLGVSKRLAEKDWTAARAWLRRELDGGATA